MTWTPTALLTWLAFSLASAPGSAQSSTLTIPLTVPPPAPVTVTLPPNTTVTANGMTYLVTGTLTLTPTSSTPGPIITPPPPVIVGALTFGGYRDRSRNPTTTAAAGDRLIIQGTSFGTGGAVVTIGGVTAPVLTQSDTELSVTVPNVPGAAAVTVNGVPDPFPLTVTPQTTLLPGTAPGDLPPHDWPPFVTDFRSALGAHVETATLGDEVVLEGNTFGDQGGVIWLGNEQVPFSSWGDGEIRLTLDPLALAPVDHATVWVIQRSGGALSVAFGPAIRKAG